MAKPEEWSATEPGKVSNELAKAAQDPLSAALDWIVKRGGASQVAEDVLKMTAGDHGYGACGPALEKAGAPGGTYALINRHLWERRKRDEE